MKNWNRKLEIAIIEKDVESIGELTYSIPTEYTSKDELIHAAALIEEAKKILDEKREELGQEMTKLKKARKYLNNH